MEIQVIRENIFRRSRYYHSQIDMEALETGIGYERLPENTKDYGDGLVSQLQTSIRQIKSSREMGNHFMQIEEMMKMEYAAGLEEGKAQGLEEGKIAARQEELLETVGRLGRVSDELSHRITALRELSVLKDLLGIAMKAGSPEQFEAEMDSIIHPTIG